MGPRLLATATLAVVLLGGCGEGTSGPGAGAIAHPTRARDLILRVDVGGGLVPVEYELTRIPGFSLFGDGRLIQAGTQIEIYPGPALPPLFETRLTEEGIQEVLREARVAGLLDGDRDYTDTGSIGIADAATTTFIVSAAGETHTVRVYALGELTDRPAGMPEEEFEARRRLTRFSSLLFDVRSWLPADAVVGEDRPFRPTAMRVFVRPYRGEPQLRQDPIDWPLGDLAAFGEPVGIAPDTRCGTVEGAELDELWPLAERANQLTPWRSGGERYGLLFRPLLPDERGC
jgi:hypothetical protein